MAWDRWLLLALNHWSRHSSLVDALAVEITHNDLFKGGVTLGFFWWAWFRRGAEARRTHAMLLAGLIAGFVALIVGRAMALFLPFRLRPLNQPNLPFVPPFGAQPDEFRLWSSFPSDHAMLFTALAVSLLYVSRRGGAVLLAWTILFISLPRVYLGLHYPSDVIGGALVGGVIAVLCQRAFVRQLVAEPLLVWRDGRPGFFYSLMFFVTFQIATLFTDLRALLQLVVHHLSKM